MWTRKSRRRPPRRQAGQRGALAAPARGRPFAQRAGRGPRRSLWRRVVMRLRALWRWGAAKLFRRYFGRAEVPGQAQARIHLLPEQRTNRL